MEAYKISKMPRALSAKYEGDFAYPTVKDRLPVILTKVIDTIHQMKGEILDKYGESGTEEQKNLIGFLSKLRNELQTNKDLVPICDNKSDVDKWNTYLERDRKKLGSDPKWFVSSWLYTECYFYRRIAEAIYKSNTLNYIDPFKIQKCNALTSCMPAVTSLVTFLQSSASQFNDKKASKQFLFDFLQISLWGNKCDLSISAGVENTQKVNAETALDGLHSFMLSDEKEMVWECLSKGGDNCHVDIVLDNSGFEVITDLILASFLLESKYVKTITLHGKVMPWFVSDVTKDDFNWTLEQLQSSENEVVVNFGKKFKSYLDEGKVTYRADDFWTLPHDFAEMKSVDPDLYNSLANADLIIFKGDLNYRKLIGDLKWECDSPFRDCLRGFLPSALVALRTLKCDVVVGITKEIAKITEEKDKEWMLTGTWAVIQFAS